MDKMYNCCICGEPFIGWGNNPWPIDNDESARCCDNCNAVYIIPARIANMQKAQMEKRHFAESKEDYKVGKSKQR